MLHVYLVLCAVLVTALGEDATLTGDKYSLRFDIINVDDIISNERLVNHYIKCMLDKVLCTPEGLEIKKLVPDALETACSKCTDKHKEFALKMFRSMYKKTAWDELAKKYDPTGEYEKRYYNTAMKLLADNKP